MQAWSRRDLMAVKCRKPRATTSATGNLSCCGVSYWRRHEVSNASGEVSGTAARHFRRSAGRFSVATRGLQRLAVRFSAGDEVFGVRQRAFKRQRDDVAGGVTLLRLGSWREVKEGKGRGIEWREERRRKKWRSFSIKWIEWWGIDARISKQIQRQTTYM